MSNVVSFCMVQFQFIFSEIPNIFSILKKQESTTAFQVLD